MYGPFRSSYPPSSQHGERKNPLRLSNYLGYERAIRPSPEKIFPPPFPRKDLANCSYVFFCEGGREGEGKKGRKEGREKRREKAGELERREEEGQEEGEMGVKERKRGVGGIVSPSGPQKSVVELEGLFVFN